MLTCCSVLHCPYSPPAFPWSFFLHRWFVLDLLPLINKKKFFFFLKMISSGLGCSSITVTKRPNPMLSTNVLWVVWDDNDNVFNLLYLRSKEGSGHVVTCSEVKQMEGLLRCGIATLSTWVTLLPALSRSSSDAFIDGFIDGFQLPVNRTLLWIGFIYDVHGIPNDYLHCLHAMEFTFKTKGQSKCFSDHVMKWKVTMKLAA